MKLLDGSVKCEQSLEKGGSNLANKPPHSEVLPANMVVKQKEEESPRGEPGNSSRLLKSYKNAKHGQKASLQSSSIEGSVWNYYDKPPVDLEDM